MVTYCTFVFLFVGFNRGSLQNRNGSYCGYLDYTTDHLRTTRCSSLWLGYICQMKSKRTCLFCYNINYFFNNENHTLVVLPEQISNVMSTLPKRTCTTDLPLTGVIVSLLTNFHSLQQPGPELPTSHTGMSQLNRSHLSYPL